MAAILVIDDDEAFRNVLRRMLLRAGHQVVEAPDGAAALGSLKRAMVDLVITDIIMPNMEGIETIRAMRRDCPTLRIIAMSGGGRMRPEGYLEVARAFGAAQVLRKPFEAAQLFAAVDAALR